MSHSPTFANTPRMSSILVRGWGKTIKPWPGQDPTFGWVSSGQGMEKSIRSSVASLESPLPHTAASAAHASPQAGLHLRLHPRRHRHTLSHPWLMAMLQKGRDVFWRSRRRLVDTNHDLLCPAVPPTILYSSVTFLPRKFGLSELL